MQVVIVRHGLSEANKRGVVSGHLDTVLTKEGKNQAQKLADRLAGLDIDVIYSSPLKRATETALPLAERLNKEIDIDRRLMELDWGSFEGKPNREFEKVFGADGRAILDTYKYDFTPFGGESSAQVKARVKSFVDDLKKQPHERVIIVCHGGIVRWLHFLITGQKITWQPNAKEIHLEI